MAEGPTSPHDPLGGQQPAARRSLKSTSPSRCYKIELPHRGVEVQGVSRGNGCGGWRSMRVVGGEHLRR
ncbi:hypothetical protein HDU96_002572, partial [Phlyctochytrium bullatum]